MAKTVEIFMAFWTSDWFLVTDIHERKKGTESETTCEKCTSVLCCALLDSGLSGAEFSRNGKVFSSVCAQRGKKASERERIAWLC